MKNYLIIILSAIANINAIYLTKWAYMIQNKEANSFVCDINNQLSCSSVFNFDFSWIFWIPFSWYAILVYLFIILITILWMKKKLWKPNNHFKILFWTWILWLIFNWYIIYHEFLENSWCVLCLTCTLILAIITYIAFKNMKDKKITVISA